MLRSSNNQIERHYFENFRKVCALPKGVVFYGDKPDVIIRGATKIGIEIRKFYLQSGKFNQSEQRQSRLRHAVVAEAQRLYLAHGGKRIELTFGFDENKPIDPGSRNELAANLASFACTHSDQVSGPIDRYLFQTEMPQIASIYVNAREYDDAKWRIAQLHKVQLSAIDKIEVIVREKERKAKNYEACDAHWLLLVVDGIDAAQEQEIRIDEPSIRCEVFERVFLFHTFGYVREIIVNK